MRSFPAFFAAAVLAGAAVAQTGQPAKTPRSAAEWRAAARTDVLAAYDVFASNHPGMFDPNNTSFPEQLARARDRALAVADRASDRTSFGQAHATFSAELADGHAFLFGASDPQGTEAEWPGFIAAWRGGRVMVHHTGRDSPAPVGSTIIGCDGETAEVMVRRRLSKTFFGFRPREAGQWWAWTPMAFMSSSVLTVPRPSRCKFRLPNGSEREARLAWAVPPDNLGPMYAMASDGERTPIGLTEPRPGIFLIGMPTFSPDDAGRDAYQSLYETISHRRAGLSGARAIVIDLRHNNGGSSLWSSLLAQRLWGQSAVRGQVNDMFRNTRVCWRASRDNVAHMNGMVQRIRSNGHERVADQLMRIRQGMESALASNRPYFIEDPRETYAPAEAPPVTPFRAPVYVITPGGCVSACLDALDIFTRFPNTRLIGAPTSADSNYLEVRRTGLPSGEGTIVIPLKVWVGRPRGPGEIYMPHLLVNDLDWSTTAFLDRIEADLQRRGSR